jgi:hypothetical protein
MCQRGLFWREVLAVSSSEQQKHLPGVAVQISNAPGPRA